jgi:hypothetical protein
MKMNLTHKLIDFTTPRRRRVAALVPIKTHAAAFRSRSGVRRLARSCAPARRRRRHNKTSKT